MFMMNIYNRARESLTNFRTDDRKPAGKAWDLASFLIYVAIIAGICWLAGAILLLVFPADAAAQSFVAKIAVCRGSCEMNSVRRAMRAPTSSSRGPRNTRQGTPTFSQRARKAVARTSDQRMRRWLVTTAHATGCPAMSSAKAARASTSARRMNCSSCCCSCFSSMIVAKLFVWGAKIARKVEKKA